MLTQGITNTIVQGRILVPQASESGSRSIEGSTTHLIEPATSNVVFVSALRYLSLHTPPAILDKYKILYRTWHNEMASAT